MILKDGTGPFLEKTEDPALEDGALTNLVTLLPIES